MVPSSPAPDLLEASRRLGEPTNLLRRGSLSLGLVFATMLAAPLGAQAPRTFGEERRITAIDLMVAFEAGAVRRWAAGGPVPKTLQPEDFEVFYDGEARPVIAVHTAAGQSPDGRWQSVIYFDAVLSSTAELRWAATVLAEEIDALVALGEVSIVLADPHPRTLLSATRDAEALQAMLSQVAQTQDASDELVALRSEVIAALRREGSELDPELLGAIAAGEVRRVRQRQDDLLLTLVEAEPKSQHRALILAGGGFDLRPEAFYQPLIASIEESTVGLAAAGLDSEATLATATGNLARTLAAYGWISLHLAPPEPEPLKEAVRIGKFRLTGPDVLVEENKNRIFLDEPEYRIFFKFFGAIPEEHRKPQRAEAYLELAAALQAQGKLRQAEDALRRAIYHYGGDPRTATRQAEAWARLGGVLAAQDKSQEANAAFELAGRLEPDSAAAEIGPPAALLAPLEPARAIARVTAGGLVRSASELRSQLEDLSRRVRLTYQVAGAPDGELHTLEANFVGAAGRRLTHPAWARSATPETVAAARVRRLVAGERTGGDLPLSAEFESAGPLSHRRGTLVLRLGRVPVAAPEAAQEGAAIRRLTLGFAGPDFEPLIEHRPLDPLPMVDGETWTHRAELELPADRPWLVVVVEDLETGSWSGRVMDLP